MLKYIHQHNRIKTIFAKWIDLGQIANDIHIRVGVDIQGQRVALLNQLTKIAAPSAHAASYSRPPDATWYFGRSTTV